MQTNRLFEIIYILLSRGTVTAKELAERFGVSVRTVYRDIDVLSLAGIPVYTEKGKGGGIRLLDEFVLNKSVLSEEEQNEILSALQGLSAVKTEDTAHVLDKLGHFFGHKTANWIEVDYSDWSFRNGEIFQRLKAAILEKRLVLFEYFNAHGEKGRRRAEPLQLWFKSKSWYLKAFCLDKNDVRTFKLTRIRGLTVSAETFPERDLLKTMGIRPPAPDPYPDVTLRLSVSAALAYRVYDEFDEREVTRGKDGRFEITVTWPEDEWVYGTILSYGEHMTVIAPEHIREIIREKIEKMAGKYL